MASGANGNGWVGRMVLGVVSVLATAGIVGNVYMFRDVGRLDSKQAETERWRAELASAQAEFSRRLTESSAGISGIRERVNEFDARFMGLRADLQSDRVTTSRLGDAVARVPVMAADIEGLRRDVARALTIADEMRRDLNALRNELRPPRPPETMEEYGP